MTAEVVAARAAGAAGEAGVVQVTLRHTGRLNAMSRAMWRQLRSVFESIQRNTDARCVLIEGRGWCVLRGRRYFGIPGVPFRRRRAARLPRKRRLGRPAGHAGLRRAHRRAHHRRLHGRGRGDCQLLRHPHCRQGARFGAPIARLGFPMAPREAQLVAGAVGDVTARQMLLEAATFTAPRCWRAAF
jgi:enoyl-CoA hydratase